MNHCYVPRDYGDEAIEAVFAEFQKVRSTLLVMATGVGKTEIYLQIAERYLMENPGKSVLIVAHREELILQPAKRWRRNLEEWPAIEMGDLKAGDYDSELFDSAFTNSRCIIASIPTLNAGKRCRNCTADCQNCGASGKILVDCEECSGYGVDEIEDCHECKGAGKVRVKCKECEGDGWICIEDDCAICFEHFTRRMQKFNPADFGLIIMDEAHHGPANTYTRLIRYFRSINPEVRLLGLTATPDRADEEALGKIFESVAYEYSLPQPIYDGWLTPIDQQFVLVDELNLSNIRTTAGDLNSGDLEQEMLAEKVLHKVTTPLVEIACGLEMGTIDRLIRANELENLPDICVKRDQTLVHAVDVAHAERMTEIINRYLPESAVCIIGTTDKTIRRESLKRFAGRDYQFLLSCGVFLEGTDLPNISIIGMARPTKSRALYSQMLGRGVRPLSGLVDGVATANERVQKIADSEKPKCLVVDFVGNSGRHKLISSADILGGELPDELVEGVIRKAAKMGQPVDMLKALALAKLQEEEERRQKARKDAERREAAQEEAKRKAAEGRKGLVAGASYDTNQVNPFDVMDVQAKREPGWHKGRKPSDKMKETLRNAKIPFTEETTYWDAHLLIEELFRRRKSGLCTYSQAKWLQEHGYSGETSFKDCQQIMNAWSQNKWQHPVNESRLGKMLEEISSARSKGELDAVGKGIASFKILAGPEMWERIINAGKARRAELDN